MQVHFVVVVVVVVSGTVIVIVNQQLSTDNPDSGTGPKVRQEVAQGEPPLLEERRRETLGMSSQRISEPSRGDTGGENGEVGMLDDHF